MTESFELNLTAMAHGGTALGRHEDRVIFVPYAIPGERVRVEICEAHTRWARARLLDVLEPSPHRVDPPCPYFGPDRCGGCQFQHIDYQAQAEFKRDVVEDQLGRVGGLHHVNVQEIIGAAQPWKYRNHVQFSVVSSQPIATA
jgi:23S rRNA (uracil1939-C5)-methyltransferase